MILRVPTGTAVKGKGRGEDRGGAEPVPHGSAQAGLHAYCDDDTRRLLL